jgi:hypothetical protein
MKHKDLNLLPQFPKPLVFNLHDYHARDVKEPVDRSLVGYDTPDSVVGHSLLCAALASWCDRSWLLGNH